MLLALLLLTIISAIGIFLTFKNKISHSILSVLVAFGAGSMLAVSLLHIFPEAVAHSHYGALAFLGGFVTMYLLEEIFSPHSHDHAHHDHSHEDPHEHSHHVAIVAFLAIFVHTLFDGMAIRAGMNLSENINYAIIFGVAIHQIPVSLSLAAIFKKSHLSKKMQIIFMIFFAFAIAIGFGILHSIFEIIWQNTAMIATAITGGSLLYIATVDLLPMTHNENSKKMVPIFAFLIGIAIMTILQIFGNDFHDHHEHQNTPTEMHEHPDYEYNNKHHYEENVTEPHNENEHHDNEHNEEDYYDEHIAHL